MGNYDAVLDLHIQSLKTCWEIIEKKQEDERNAAQVVQIFKKLLVVPQAKFMELFRFFYIYRENILKYRSFHGKWRKLIWEIMTFDFGS